MDFHQNTSQGNRLARINIDFNDFLTHLSINNVDKWTLGDLRKLGVNKYLKYALEQTDIKFITKSEDLAQLINDIVFSLHQALNH